MALCLHLIVGEKTPGFNGYSLYDSPGNRQMPDPENVAFALNNQEIVAQARLHPRFPRTIIEVFVEGELTDTETAAFLTDVEALMQLEG